MVVCIKEERGKVDERAACKRKIYNQMQKMQKRGKMIYRARRAARPAKTAAAPLRTTVDPELGT